MKESNGHKIFAVHENKSFKEFLSSKRKNDKPSKDIARTELI